MADNPSTSVTRLWPTFHLFCAVAVCVGVAAGTLLPFTFNAPWPGAADWFGLSQIGWPTPPTSDIVINVLVYLPVGAAVAWVFSGFFLSPAVGMAMTGAFGLMMSILLEWLQTIIPSRMSSWFDVCLNGAGTIAGAGATLLIVWCLRTTSLKRRVVEHLRAQPFATAAAALAIGLMFYHLLPFDFVTTTEALWQSLGQTRVWPTPSLDGQHAYAPWLISAGYAAPFALLGLLLMWSRRGKTSSRYDALVKSVAGVLAIALAVEVAQLFVISHAFDLMDLLAAAVGAGVGVAVGCFLDPRTALTLRRIPLVLLLVQVSYILVQSAAPFDLAWENADLSRVVRIPFAAQFHRPFAAAMADMLESAVMFAIVATLLCAATPRLGRYTRVLGVGAAVLAIASTAELLQLLTPARYPDVTGPLIATFVAVTVALWAPLAWNRFATIAVAETPLDQSS